MTAPSAEEKKRKDAQAALREAVREAVREEIATFREAVRQVVSEERANQAPVSQQDLSPELGAIDAQIEAMRAELQFVRTAIDLLVKAGQAQALASATPIGRIAPQNLADAATTRRPVQQDWQQEEIVTHEEEDIEDSYEAALPLPRDIRLPKGDEGPTPIVLLLRSEGRV